MLPGFLRCSNIAKETTTDPSLKSAKAFVPFWTNGIEGPKDTNRWLNLYQPTENDENTPNSPRVGQKLCDGKVQKFEELYDERV